MKILLTGANGFIGSHLVKKLLDQDHQLTVIKRQSSDLNRIKQYVSSIQFYNYEDHDVFHEVFKTSIDIVIHLAGVYIKNDNTAEDIHRITRFNIDTASQLVHHATHNGVKGFINTGTFFEYNLTSSKPLHEQSAIVPFNYYAACKVAFAQILKYFATSSKLRAVTLKLFSPYGEMDNDKIIPLILKSVLTRKTLVLQDSSQTLSFTYIDDIIDAYLKAITYIEKKEFTYEDFNIGADTSYSIREIIDLVSDITKEDVLVEFNKTKLHQKQAIRVLCDNSKAQQMLQWQPGIDIKDGLKKTYEYYKKVI